MSTMKFMFEDAKEVSKKRKNVTLIFGKPGTGKTRFAGTLPGKTLLIQCGENGSDSAADKDVLVYTVKDFPEFTEIINQLPALVKQYKADGVAIDTINGVQGLFAKLVGKNTKSGGMEIQHYLQWNNKLKDLISYLEIMALENNFEVLLLAHEKNFSKVNTTGEYTTDDFGAALSQGASAIIHASAQYNIKTLVISEERKDNEGNIIFDETGNPIKEQKFKLLIGKSADNRTKVRVAADIKITKELVIPNFGWEFAMEFIKYIPNVNDDEKVTKLIDALEKSGATNSIAWLKKQNKK